MNPKPVVFTKDDLIFVKARALEHYKTINGNKQLPDEGTSLTHSELISLAWIQAVDDLLVKKGCGTNIMADLTEPSSEALEEMYEFEGKDTQ